MGQRTSKLIKEDAPDCITYPGMHDLDEMIKKWVIEQYQNTNNSRNRKAFFPKKKHNISNFAIQIDYGSLNVEHNTPKYDTESKKGSPAELDGRMFINDTPVQQQYKYLISKPRRYTYTYKVEKTLKVESTTNLKLKLPDLVLEASQSDIPDFVDITDIKEKQFEFQQNMEVDRIVTVPASSTVSASCMVIDNHLYGWFTLSSSISGYVNMVLMNEKGKTVDEYNCDISSIVKNSFCEDIVPSDETVAIGPCGEYSACASSSESFEVFEKTPEKGNVDGIHWDIGKNIVHVESKGYCTFNYCKERPVTRTVMQN